MEVLQHSENKGFRVKGQLKIIAKDADGNVTSVYETSNYIVFQALDIIKDLLLGVLSGSSLYRMGLGSGGYNGMGVRYLPDATWDSKVDMNVPVYSRDLDSITTSVTGTTIGINMVTTFDSSEIGAPFAPTLEVSEACVIFGSGTAGPQSGAAYLGALDKLFAYRTFEKKSFAPGAGTTLEVHWSIFLEKV